MPERAPHPARRWLRGLLAACVLVVIVALALAAYLLFGMGPRVPQEPIRLVRGPDGRLVPAEAPKPEAGLSFEALAANTVSTNSLSSTASTVSSANTRLASRRILILNRSSHLLMQRVGPCLLAYLANLHCADEVNYVPDGRVAAAGGPAPDVIVTLDMPAVQESSGLAESRLTATIVAGAGTTLAAGHTNTVDDMTPPSLRFRWTANLEHQSVTKGIASRSAKFKPQAEDIARQLGEALVKLLNSYQEKYGLLPELPAAFYPDYRPAGPLPFLDGYTLEPLASWHGLMVHNDSYWRMTASADEGQVLSELRTKMQAAGWRVDAGGGSGSPAELRAVREDAVVSVFPAEEEAALYVHYVDRMARADLAAAVDATLTDSAPTDVLLLFAGSWSRAQRTRALDLLRTRPLATPDAYLALAEVCQSAGRESQAREALARAAALMLVTADTGELDTRARSIAGRLGAPNLLDAPLTQATLAAAGFTQMPSDGQTIERGLGVDEAALFYVRGPGGQVRAASVRVVRDSSQAGRAAYQLAYVDSDGGGKSWGRTGSISSQEGLSQPLLRGKAEVTVRQEPGQERFLLSARLLPERP